MKIYNHCRAYISILDYEYNNSSAVERYFRMGISFTKEKGRGL